MKKLRLAVLTLVSCFLIACSVVPTKSPSKPIAVTERGKASFYANKYQGRKTASGEKLNQSAKTAAHKKLPFGTKVKVTNIENSKSVIVRINDRGPFVKDRIIDLSRSAFSAIGDTRAGVINVTIEVVE